MTIALKIGSQDSQIQGFIYLDAVTRYGRDLSGKVTSFPVDSGANISDHFISNNPKFTLEGVISDVDITGVSDTVRLDDQKPMNAKAKPVTPVINEQQSTLQFLPSAVKQFLDKTSANVSVDPSSQTTIPAIQMLLVELMKGVYYNSADNRWRNKMTATTLYEMEGSNFVNAHTDLVITNVGFEEDTETGDALKLSLSMEQIRLVNIDKTDMPRLAKPAVQKKVASTAKKGTPDCPSGKTDTESANNSTGDKAKAPIANSLSSAIESSKAARR